MALKICNKKNLNQHYSLSLWYQESKYLGTFQPKQVIMTELMFAIFSDFYFQG